MNELALKLKSTNLKVTPQRLAIYNLLVNTTKHPSAESIYNELKPQYPTMSLATVYKTLASLKIANLVQEINVGEDSFRYDADIYFHPHIICTRCYEVYDYHGPVELSPLKSTISQNLDFDIEAEQLFFYGCCKDCRQHQN